MKCTRLFFLLVSVFIFAFKAHSQIECGFDNLHQQGMKADAGYREFVKSFESKLRELSRKTMKADQLHSTLSSFADTIAVVVHIIHTGDMPGTVYNPSDSLIQAAIDHANQAYSGSFQGITGAGDIGIRFALAKRDPYCNATNGIDRVDGSILPLYVEEGISIEGDPTHGVTSQQLKQFVEWDPNRYYNIWVVNNINSAGNADAYAGFSFFPFENAQIGTVITAYQMNGHSFTLAHELGHAFFLYHPFEGSSGSACPINNDCSTDGDQVCDTDPITKPAGEDRSGINPCTNALFSDNTEKNFMNYVGNRTLFTEGQKIRMQLTAINNPLMDTLSKSLGRFSPDAEPACSFALRLDGQLDQNNIHLSWRGISSDKNGYYVERSYDGARFTSIAFLQRSQQSNDYHFYDQEISQQRNYYRINHINAAGDIIYSNTVIINNPITNDRQLILLSNPSKNDIDFQLGLFTNSSGDIFANTHASAEIRLLDMSGKIIKKLTMPVATYQRYRIPVNNIRPGVYLLQVLLNNVLYTKKVVKI